MHRRRLFLISLCCFAVIAAVVTIGSAARPAVRMEARVLDSVMTDGTNFVTAQFHEFNRSPILPESLQLQFRIAGKWGSPQLQPDYQDYFHYLPAGTNAQNVVFAVPAGADACRFSLAYRGVGVSGCRVSSFLYRHGLLQNSPNLRSHVVRLVAHRSGLRQVQFELELPTDGRVKLAAVN